MECWTIQRISIYCKWPSTELCVSKWYKIVKFVYVIWPQVSTFWLWPVAFSWIPKRFLISFWGASDFISSHDDNNVLFSKESSAMNSIKCLNFNLLSRWFIWLFKSRKVSIQDHRQKIESNLLIEKHSKTVCKELYGKFRWELFSNLMNF